MPKQCAVINCKRSYKTGNGIQLFHFPIKDENRCNLWIKAIGREDWQPTKYSVVCSHHFNPWDYLNRPNANKQYLRPDAVPSLSLELNDSTIPIAPKSAKRKLHEKDINENTHVKTEIIIEIYQDVIPGDNKSQIENMEKCEPEEKKLRAENYVLGNNHDERASYVPPLENIFPHIKQQKSSLSDKCTQTECISNTQPDNELRKKIRCMQQKIRRQTKKINKMAECLNELRKPKIQKTQSLMCTSSTDHTYC